MEAPVAVRGRMELITGVLSARMSSAQAPPVLVHSSATLARSAETRPNSSGVKVCENFCFLSLRNTHFLERSSSCLFVTRKNAQLTQLQCLTHWQTQGTEKSVKCNTHLAHYVSCVWGVSPVGGWGPRRQHIHDSIRPSRLRRARHKNATTRHLGQNWAQAPNELFSWEPRTTSAFNPGVPKLNGAKWHVDIGLFCFAKPELKWEMNTKDDTH